MSGPASRDPRGLPLSPRQLDVLAALVESGSMQEAADAVGISVSTARGYMTLAYAKLGLSGETSAIRAVWMNRHEIEARLSR